MDLLKKSNSLPESSGCYLMKDLHGQVIYVGKAKNLKSRVKSYFNNSAKSAKTTILVSKIKDFDFIITNSDAESLVLENNLIKDHQPKYNIRLRDDKSYPYIRVDKRHEYPRLEYVRRPKKEKGVELYGPYPSGYAVLATMRVLTKAFNLRDCSDREFQSRKVACILYQMNHCSAPCVDKITPSAYREDLETALKFFQGKNQMKQGLRVLEEKMFEAAENESYEKAAMIRDALRELEEFAQLSYSQDVELLDDKDVDVFAYYLGQEELDISLYMIRRGSLLGHKSFHFYRDDFMEDVEDEFLSFLLQYYAQSQDPIPQTIALDTDRSRLAAFTDALKSLVEGKTSLRIFGKSKKYEGLLNAARKHAQETQRVRIENASSVFTGLNKLKELLNLKERPQKLECYDIAVWQGHSPTAAQIVFEEGKPDKKSYRHYHLEERPEGNNDFAMMKEVFQRRMKRGNLPDVFIVDGGIAQVNTAKAALKEVQCSIPVVGIAKSRDIARSFKSEKVDRTQERLIIPGRSNPYFLSKCPSLMRVIVQMRDEAHRFSRKLHHKDQKSRLIRSWIDEVPGIGIVTRNKILKKLDLTKEEVSLMTVEQISDRLEIGQRHAQLIASFLRANDD